MLKLKYRNYCRLCETNYYNFEEHKKDDTHKKKLVNKYVFKNNGKEYYYDKEKYSSKERLKNPEIKKRHYNLLQKKVNCYICNCQVIYSSLWRHNKSKKHLKNLK